MGGVFRIGPEPSRARSWAQRTLDGEDRSGIIQGEGKSRGARLE